MKQGGEYYWRYCGDTTTAWLRDFDKGMICIGSSLDGAINALFEKGLLNNPGIVDEVLNHAETEWEEARQKWLDTEHDESNELNEMKKHELVKKMVEFKFNTSKIPTAAKEKPWLHVLNVTRGSLLYSVLQKSEGALVNDFLENLMGHLIYVFGQSFNTKQLLETIKSTIESANEDQWNLIIKKLSQNRRFEPKEE